MATARIYSSARVASTTARELAESLRRRRIRVSDEAVECFLLDWERAGIAERD
jgi:hypothetical protein